MCKRIKTKNCSPLPYDDRADTLGMKFKQLPNDWTSKLNLDYFDFLRMRSLSDGIIYINTEINLGQAEKVSLELEHVQAMGLKEVRVIIDSPGGNVSAGLGIYDSLMAFKSRGGRVVTESRGYAASMGAIILQAGDERLCTKNSRILIHEVSQFKFFETETASDSEEKAKELTKVNKHLVKILAERSGNSEQKVSKMIKKKDFWMSPDEALKLNFVDKII